MNFSDIPFGAMVQTIVDTVHPKTIVLFGSRARGDASLSSDVDFLIVEDHSFKDERERTRETMRILWALAKYRIPTDIVLCSGDEKNCWEGTRNHVVARAMRDGKRLYDRP